MTLPISPKDSLALNAKRLFASSTMPTSTVAFVSAPTAENKPFQYLILTFRIVKIAVTDIALLANKLLKDFVSVYALFVISSTVRSMNANLFATHVEGKQIK